ncbi:hypothetical protein DR64_258 [Paraburkholderia xenovorans LB400]|jgi:hypothetical protein|uniref:Thymidylate synthase n=1 Tax=Paraburkholderia xenovorans (strain LB400) TaxID=266265 RepID=Q13ZS5_PARXL|nr:hypothetical protein [Paraburkholderia xenovorans]ABE30414.1 hypothetical protein Bxe_A2565 [Paraburkholderia xenovorans LB400]AIP29770.1 hypothetical protein DR64_258 [Paraburkholderia xenovorans LB400]
MIKPLFKSASSISEAWADVFLSTMEKGGATRHPVVVTIDGLEHNREIEVPSIRTRLDTELVAFSENKCNTVANTIFPMSMWNPHLDDDADALFRRYERAWPGIKKCPANKYGVYFRRLTAYQPNGVQKSVNQLESIIDSYQRGNHRKSALQVSVFDPTRDHTNQRQKGFPCLQQVSFTPLENGLLSVTGFYATQYQFEKAYGNYLGLYWLGKFVAAQLNMTLSQVVCSAAVLSRGNPKAHQLQPLATDIQNMLDELRAQPKNQT